MSKINLILHDTTLIDFRFLGRLLKRYWPWALLATLIVFAISSYMYVTQDTLYIRSGRFKNDSTVHKKMSGLESMSLSSFAGGGIQSGLKYDEVVGIVTSWSFLKRLAERIHMLPNVKELNLNSPQNNTGQTVDDMIMHCSGNSDCISNSLSSKLRDLFYVEKNKSIPGFRLKVTTLDKNTTDVLLHEIAGEIQEQRKDDLKKSIVVKIDTIEQMIAKKRKEIEAKKAQQKSPEKILLMTNVNEVTLKIKNIRSQLNRAKGQLYPLKLRLKHAVEGKRIAIDSSVRANYEKKKLLEEEILEYRENIQLLSENNDEQNNAIVAELQRKLQKATADLAELGDTRENVESLDRLDNSRQNQIPKLRVDVKVLEENIAKLNAELRKLLQKKEKYLMGLGDFDDRSDIIRPEMMLLHKLESQHNAFLLEESSIVSDLVFEDFDPASQRYQRSSLLRSLAYACILSCFVAFVVVTIRFMTDNRVYSIEELEKVFSDMKVLGSTLEMSSTEEDKSIL